jgi:hypothetical protein
VQLKDTQAKQLASPHNVGLIRGNCIRKQNGITVSNTFLHRNNLFTWWWPVRPKHVEIYCAIKRRRYIQTAQNRNANERGSCSLILYFGTSVIFRLIIASTFGSSALWQRVGRYKRCDATYCLHLQGKQSSLEDGAILLLTRLHGVIT